MEIIRESSTNYKEFENIAYGTIFEYDDYFYIKTNEEDDKINAVCLNDGETAVFRPIDMVKIVKASLIIKE